MRQPQTWVKNGSVGHPHGLRHDLGGKDKEGGVEGVRRAADQDSESDEHRIADEQIEIVAHSKLTF